ncbi:MAG TPA: CsbD family protein [Stellaceae bacterium]|nr:CsbD family protein [Stellaceae bacterium]
MDKNRVECTAKQAGGAVKEAAGKALGDKKTEGEGAAKKAEGKVQNAVGGVKDKARDMVDKHNDK